MAIQPKPFQGIMLSSTFTDLKEHRQKAKTAMEKLDFHAVGMESGGAQVADVIEASLNYVRQSAAYIGIVTKKYGQTPHDPVRNPDRLSITELEFNEALRLKLPILLFIMDKAHLVHEDDVELNPEKREKLAAFIARAKLANGDGEVERVWETFTDMNDFAARVGPAIGNLKRILNEPAAPSFAAVEAVAPEIPRDMAPALRALPPYIGSHDFIGRSAELGVLDDWASSADAHPVLLFEAMGGTGKSMLTWHWLNECAASVRSDWAGRFWYSFYEQGATLVDFCREALSYMTGASTKAFAQMRAAELSHRLIAELDSKPWLLVLDGLERILVGYHRSDAAQLRDEDVELIRDPMSDRDPCLAIRPEDDELLRRLAAAKQSKILISTRLTPAKLVNKSGRELSGVKRELLKGLRPADAERLFLDCGVRGSSREIQPFLQANCDGHPLVIGVLAGLVNDYLPDRGNFAAWRDAPAYGGKLDWSKLDLVQSRNHILDEAIAALDTMSRQLLHGLALLIGGADYPLLEAINPHLPPKPVEVSKPNEPVPWGGKDQQDAAQARYAAASRKYEQYLSDLASWTANPAVESAERELSATVRNLEKRGLLQYDPEGHRYDLHPVVRGVASSRMSGEEHASSGGRVIDYCRAASPNSWDGAETLQDIALGRQLVAMLLGMKRFEEALEVFRGSLSNAFLYKLEADAEMLALLKGFFPNGWNSTPSLKSTDDQSYIITCASVSLSHFDMATSKSLAEFCIKLELESSVSYDFSTLLSNLSIFFGLADTKYLYDNALTISELNNNGQSIYVTHLDLFTIYVYIGNYEIADSIWDKLQKMPHPVNGATYRQGRAEKEYAWYCFRKGSLTEDILAKAEQTASKGMGRHLVRELALLRGQWCLEKGDEAAAVASLQSAVAMARSVGRNAVAAESALALARLRSGDAQGARLDAEGLEDQKGLFSFYVGKVWAELGERERAIAAALKAHEVAIGDGEPYVYRWELDRTRNLLTELGADLPEIPVYDPSTAPVFDWQPQLDALIERLKQEKAARDAKMDSSKDGED